MEKKSLNSPEETRKFEKGKVDLVTVGGVTFGLVKFEPGWKWSKHVKPIAKTESCQVAHTMYMKSGKMKVVMDDGTEKEFGAGDVGIVPPGHDAWVVGNEAVVAIDVSGMKEYAKK
jgi:quercetin dioxygenase-like cupin family protein